MRILDTVLCVIISDEEIKCKTSYNFHTVFPDFTPPKYYVPQLLANEAVIKITQ